MYLNEKIIDMITYDYEKNGDVTPKTATKGNWRMILFFAQKDRQISSKTFCFRAHQNTNFAPLSRS